MELHVTDTTSTVRAVNSDPWKLGEKYLIRTVTHYAVGRLIFVGPQELVLEDAAWVPNTGRYGDALRDGTLEEVEPSPGLKIVGRGAIVDADVWSFDLPRDQK